MARKSPGKKKPARKNPGKKTPGRMKALTAAEKTALEAAGIIVTDERVPLAQKTAPVDPAAVAAAAPQGTRFEALLALDSSGKFTSPLMKGKAFDSLADLIDALR